MAKRFPTAKFTHVEGAYLLWVDFRPCGIRNPHQWLMKEAGIYTHDGVSFGQPGYVRINFGTSRNVLTQALDRIERALVNERK